MEEEMLVLQQKEFPNGIVMTIADASRKLVGDRWLVKLICRIGMNAEVRQRLGVPAHKEVAMVCNRQRNFIDERQKEEIRRQLIVQLIDHFEPYCAKSDFPDRLLAWSNGGALAEKKVAAPGNRFAYLDDQGGTADFSFLFRDAEGEKTA